MCKCFFGFEFIISMGFIGSHTKVILTYSELNSINRHEYITLLEFMMIREHNGSNMDIVSRYLRYLLSIVWRKIIMISRKSLAFSLLGIIVVAGLGIGIYYLNEGSRDVSIGYLEGDLHQLAFFIAREQGLYTQEGLSIESVAFENGGAVMTAFEAANRGIDLAYFGFAPALFHRFTNQAANITV
ncbi:MAG: hypothetical protein ACTSUK_06325, partial [Promethearchaeota archaeon]